MADDEHGARGNGDDAGHAERNAEREAQFRALPPAGSAEYWAAIEAGVGGYLLPLEVLAMCMRERLAAGARDQAERVFETIMKRVQRALRIRIERMTPGAHDRASLIEDLQQNCTIKLWQELTSHGDTFFTRGFWRRFDYLVLNEVLQGLIEAGERARPGVDRPTRIPRHDIKSLDQPADPDDPRTLGELTPEPHSDDTFGLVELVNDIREMLKHLSSEERLLLWNEITGELTQKEIAQTFGVTDRTVRSWLKAIRAKLRNRRDNGGSHGEEEHRG